MSRTTIVITGRNNGQFLPATIESALGQAVPCEVVYSDDCSIDDSVEIASKYPIRVVRSLTHQGVCSARNYGASEVFTEFVLFLDSEDVLDADYVKHAQNVLDNNPEAPFAYGTAQAFGEHDTFWDVPVKWSGAIWLRNWCNTSALRRTALFWAAGGWKDNTRSTWDWSLALRMAKLGTPVSCRESRLYYRQWPGSWSHQTTEHDSPDLLKEVRNTCSVVTVATVYSGRRKDLFPRWLDAVALSLRLLSKTKPQSRYHLLVLDASPDQSLNLSLLKKYEYLSGYKVEHLRPYSYNSEVERRNKVCEFMAEAMNRITELTVGSDIVWCIEDDIIVPLRAAHRLHDLLISGWAGIPHAVAGMYQNRHHREYMVGGYSDLHGAGQPGDLKWPGEGKQEPYQIDFTGTGCLMYWRDRCPTEWHGYTETGVQAHDWRWGMDLKKAGGTLLMVPDIRCIHDPA